MTKKQRRMAKRIGVSAALFAAGMLLPLAGSGAEYENYLVLVIFLAGYTIVGWDIVWRAVMNIRRGEVFDECFLMVTATFGAFALGEYAEGVAVMLFYQIGEWFQSYAVAKSRRSIASLMDIRPDYANVERDGKLHMVAPEEVQLGEVITVKPGERVPLDGTVLEGTSSMDTSALTGESLPRDIGPGMEIISGCINQTGVLRVKTSKVFGESTVARILDLVENSSAKKAKTENFITRFARYYTPVVVGAALALAVLPPLLTGAAFSEWIYRALTFLVISCPCALVISVPLSFFGGLGGASKCGVLVKGSNYLEVLANTEVIVFDKTGTLTKGSFAVTKVEPQHMSRAQLLELAAYAENYSHHPIAQSVRRAYAKEIDSARVERVEELAGHGIRAVVDGRTILLGNAKLMEQAGITYPLCKLPGTVLYLAQDGVFAGYILAEDEAKEDAADAIRALKADGIRHTVMLTGDSDAVGRHVADVLGVDEVCTQLLPEDKVTQVERLMQELPQSGRAKLAFVGDGINDAPVLARADVGIAMGALGSDAAIEAADVVLMTDEPYKIVTARRIARKTLRIARENIVFAIGVKLVVLVLGAMGYASMWAAVFADVGVCFLAILNAIRALQVKELEPAALQKKTAASGIAAEIL